MTKDYLLEHGSAPTPQSEPLRPDQVENSAGGYAWPVDDITRLRRFLILGSEGGSYYASERDLTKENLDVVRKLARENGGLLVAEAVAVSEAGRAPSNDPALYALACAISLGDRATKRAAAEALPRVARIGTHLYHFVTYAESMRGWGKTLRWAVNNWYRSHAPADLAYDAVKYRQRDGWSHRDLVRLAGGSGFPGLEPVIGFISGNVGHERGVDEEGRANTTVTPWEPTAATPSVIEGFLLAQKASSPAATAKLVRDYRLPREALKSEHLADPEVWRALLDTGMPTGALVRNLANMTRLGVLQGSYRGLVVGRLSREAEIRKARLHPIAILLALATYASGKGMRGQNTWTPIPAVTDALDQAFYLAFENVEATGKRYLLAVDVSGSMDWPQSCVAGTPLTSRACAAAMALVTLHVEDEVDVVAFSDGLQPVGLSRRQRLDDVVGSFQRMRAGGTDCSLPMQWAQQNRRDYDAFVVYTDNETWQGPVHPAAALQEYRRRSGNAARLAVVGMVSNGFSIADPTDAGMMDVVGFDTSAPATISDFCSGRL